LERKGPTPAAQSSRPNTKLGNFNIIVSSFAALAGVGLAGYQVLAPSTPQQPAPVQVTVAIDPAKVAEPQETVEAPVMKSDAEASVIATTFSAALKDGSELRYRFADLFDGNPETYLTVTAPDTEINVLVTFGNGMGQVSEIEYMPPAGVDPARLATIADLMVLPDGAMGAAGRPVTSFKLPIDGGRTSFALAAPEQGKGLWLRVAGGEVIGDFVIRRPPP
jgi:hypothetical protein